MNEQNVSILDSDEEQHYDITQLIKLLKDTQEELKCKEKKIDEISAKFSRFQLESKAKVASLNHKLQLCETALKLQSEQNNPELASELTQRIAFLEEQLGRLQLQVVKSTDILSVNSKLEAENLKLHEHLKENQETVYQYKHKIMQISEEKDLQIENLQTNCNGITEKNMHLTQALEGINKLKCDLEDQTLSLKENIGTIKANNDSLEKEVSVLKDEKIALEMKVIELEEICEGSKTQSRDLHRKIHDFLQGKVVSSAQQTPLTQVEAFIEQMLVIKTEKNVLASENTKLQNENKNLSKCFTELEQGMLELSNSVENYESRLTKKDQELATLRSSVELFQKNIATMFETVEVQNMEEFVYKWNSQIQELNVLKTKSTEEKVIQCDIGKKENESITSESKRLVALMYDFKSRHDEMLNKDNELRAINNEVERLSALLKHKEKLLSDQTAQISHVLLPYLQNEDLWIDITNKSDNPKIMNLTFKEGILRIQRKLKCDHEMLNKMAAELKQSKELHENAVEAWKYIKNTLSSHKEKYSQLILTIKDAYNSFFSSEHLTSPLKDEITAVQKIKQLLYDNKDQITNICSQNEILQFRVRELVSIYENAIIYSNSLEHELRTQSQVIIAYNKKTAQLLSTICKEKVQIQQDFQELRNDSENYAIRITQTLSDLNVEVNRKLEEAAKKINSLNSRIRVKKNEIHFMKNKLHEQEQRTEVLCAELKKKDDEIVEYEKEMKIIENLALEANEAYWSVTESFSEVKEQTQTKLQAYADPNSAVTQKLSYPNNSPIGYMQSVKVLKNENMAIKQINQNLKAELHEKMHFLVEKECINIKLKDELDFHMKQEDKCRQGTVSNLLIEKNMLEKCNDERQSSNSKNMNLRDVYIKEKVLCDENDAKETCSQKVILDLESQKGNLDVELHKQNRQVKELDIEICKAPEQECDLVNNHIQPKMEVSHYVPPKLAMIHQRLLIEEKKASEVFQGSSNELDTALNLQKEQGMMDDEDMPYTNERVNSDNDVAENEELPFHELLKKKTL